MVGIVSYGAYIPMLRMSREVIGKAWGGRAAGGERSVANHDEDSTTMAVAAGIDCLTGIGREQVDGLYVATSTSPYREKQISSIVALALDLKREALTADFGDSLRASTTALRSAAETVKSGSAKRVLVTAADCRLGAPQGEFEQSFGDGAAALLVGDSDVAVEIEGQYSFSEEFTDLWRSDSDVFVRSWEDRFILKHGYGDNIREAVRGILKKYNLTPKDFARVVLYAPDPRNQLAAARDLGFDVKTQLADNLFNTVGNTGAAYALMMLVSALEEAKPGDKILLANCGDGGDAYILRVTEQIEKVRNRHGIKGNLPRKRPIPSYEKYLRFRQIIPTEAARRPAISSSLPRSWRERKSLISFYGSKCRRCGTLQFLPERICYDCRAKDEFDPVRLSDKKGTVFTFVKDFLYSNIDPPTVMGVYELEDDCRLYLQMTDCDPDKVKVGMPVEFTFRKIFDASGIHNYFWKATPTEEK